ncbi:MAG: NUDIX domain-containing protein [Ignavibacteria bacterium]|nr:NUDIX domain-containing protein [Ignavibacteria bacterium]
MPTLDSKFVEVCVFKRNVHSALYLLLQRSFSETRYPLMWQIITATIEPGETAIQTAQREIKEETQLTPLAMWHVPFVNSYFDAKTDAIHFISVFAAEVDETNEPILSKEHQAYEWRTLAHSKEKLVWHGQIRGLEIVDEFIVGKKEAERYSRIF